MTHDTGEDSALTFSSLFAADASPAFFRRKFSLKLYRGDRAVGLLSKQDISSESGFFRNREKKKEQSNSFALSFKAA